MKQSYLKKYFTILHYYCKTNLIPCSSRKIACIISDKENRILSFSYNGPPKGFYHSYDLEWLKRLLDSGILNEKDVAVLKNTYGSIDEALKSIQQTKSCIRRILNCQSGERQELCLCVHAEQNAIINSNAKLNNCNLLIYGPTPCIFCARMIINTGIDCIYYISEFGIYDENAMWILNRKGINVIPISLSIVENLT